MIGEYRGKRMFAGRLFAGRLFGPTQTAAVSGGRRRVRMPASLIDAQALRAIDEDDTLLLLAAALCAGSGLLQ